MSNHDNTSLNTSPEKGLIAWFAGNHVAANILMMLLLVGGILSVSTMRTETFPAIDPKLITVTTVYPGATPYEIADSITNRIEEEIIGTEGVERIVSSASEGSGTVSIELTDFADADDVYTDVENAVNGLTDFPPENAERPIITKVKVTPSVMSIALHGNVPEEIIKYWAETIEDELRQRPNVALISLRGLRDYQISIDVSESSLRRYGLTLQDVGAAVERFSIDIPAGTVESDQGNIVLRVQEKRYTGEDFRSIAIRTLEDGSTLQLGDIATIVDGFEDVNLISKFNGERAAFIDISRNETEDTLTVAQSVKDYIANAQLPEGLNITIQRDDTIALKDRMNLMLRNAIIGFMLVFIVLLLFLDLKLAFWTSAAIPISFLGGMMLVNFMGYSINMVSLFALIVVLGIVVDDAIITGESIFEAQNNGEKDAVLKGVRSVIAPVTVGVTTTIAAFAPLLFSTGVLGQIIKAVPVVVIAILIVSLIEAYFILPAHLSNPKRWSKGVMARLRDGFARGLKSFTDNVILPFARFTITFRYITLSVFIGFAIITAALFTSGTVRFVFFPNVEGEEVTINVTMPEGTPFSLTQKTLLDIEREVLDVNEKNIYKDTEPFKSVSVSIGQVSSAVNNPGRAAGGVTASNIGQVKIALVPSDGRNVSSSKVESLIRSRIQDFPSIEELEIQSSLIGEEADVEIELSHSNDDKLNEAAESLKSMIREIEGTKEIADSYDYGKTEYVFSLTDEGRAANLTPADLGQQLRASFFGLEAQRFQRGRSEVIVYVRYPKDERENLNALMNSRIRLADGTEVPLNTVADINKQLGFSTIQTVNGRRIVSVTADVDYAVSTPNKVIQMIRETYLPQLQERFPGVTYSFEGESKEQQQDLASLGRSMIIALMIIYILLGSQLRSYVQPLIIMSAIPFGVVGAIWGHYLLGYDVSFLSIFGIVALTGVVVNDSVVLMDFYNQVIAQGKSKQDAVILAIQRRFRPILLTTLTTSLGLLPIILETSLQAQFLIPMVVSLATGIIFATFVILILIPSLLIIFEDIKNLPRFNRSRRV